MSRYGAAKTGAGHSNFFPLRIAARSICGSRRGALMLFLAVIYGAGVLAAGAFWIILLVWSPPSV
jgi:hypothetical protein